jgi:hypothetical protein
MVAVEVVGLVRLVRLERVAALDAVGLGGAGRVRRVVAAIALVHLHATELVVQRARAVGHARALRLAGMRRLRARVERVGAGPRARARGLGQRGARLVVGDVGLARVGEEGQDGRDALRRRGAAGRDGDEESGRRSGTYHNTTARAWAYSIKWSFTARDTRVSQGPIESVRGHCASVHVCGGRREAAQQTWRAPGQEQGPYLFLRRTG